MNWPRLLAALAMVGLGAVAAYAVLALAAEAVTVPPRPAGPSERDITDFSGDVGAWLRNEGY